MRRVLFLVAAAACAGGALTVLWLAGRNATRDEAAAFELTEPTASGVLGDATPRVRGRAAADAWVTVRVYAGPRARGRPVRRLATRADSRGRFEVVLREPLLAGTYTVRALERRLSETTERTADSSFVLWRHTDATRGVPLRGTFVGGPTLGVAGPVPRRRSAVSFDGVDDYLAVADSAAVDAEKGVTIALWIRRGKFGSWQVLVGKPGNGRSKLENYSVWLDEADRAVAFFGDGEHYARVDTPAPLSGGWHHVAATYDNKIARMYVDGLLQASVPSSVRLTPNGLPLNVGRTNGGTDFYAGLLDRVEIYPVRLSSADIRALFERAASARVTPPAVSLTTPEAGSSTSDPTPAFAGMAGTTSLDSRQVRVEVYEGARVSGRLIQTLTATRLPSGAWGLSARATLPAGTYTARAEQSDRLSNVARSPAATFTVAAQAASSHPVLVAAGDLADCESRGDEATAALVGATRGIVATLGDHAYPWGRPGEWRNCYEPTWGRYRRRTRPTIGGHEYGEASGDPSPYFRYFRAQLAPYGRTAIDPKKGWYSYDVGHWHVVVLNTTWREVGLPTADSAQVRWLRADLAAHPARCTLAMFHDPVFSSGRNGGSFSYRPLWEVLYEHGVEIVLNGHDHDYERFAPQRPNGSYDPVRGIRQFVVGTGGASHYSFRDGKGILANSEVRNDDTYGVLKLILRTRGYDWQFIPEAGRAFTDSGSGTCH